MICRKYAKMVFWDSQILIKRYVSIYEQFISVFVQLQIAQELCLIVFVQ